MTRRHRLAPLALLALLGCQDYNFTPATYCLIQPGSERFTLSDVSTADVLFVVDDSGSMGGEQANLAASFGAFVDSLESTNLSRVQSGLLPIDFHIAITTTSVFLNAQTNSVCAASCAGASGQVCCDTITSQPLAAYDCAGDAACAGTGGTCRSDCAGRVGERSCCAAAGAAPVLVPQPCPTVGAACGVVQRRYEVPREAVACSSNAQCDGANGYTCRTDCLNLSGSHCCKDFGTEPNEIGIPQRVPTCDIGVGVEGGLYPQGDFVAATGNPRVLHFDKDLFCQLDDPAAPTRCVGSLVDQAAIDALIAQFNQNIAVGTCGSGQEMPLEAARRAVEKALAGEQPGVAAGEWPHDVSKLVVVVVGDEDDCSTPEDGNRGVIYLPPPATDACEADDALPPEQRKRFPVRDYSDYFAGLGRPYAGAVVASTLPASCGLPLSPSGDVGACTPGICAPTACTEVPAGCAGSTCYTCAPATCTEAPAVCGGQGAGFRLLELSGAFAGKGADSVAGSICVTDFSPVLKQVAEIVKQPQGLVLPTQPARADLTVLRIVGRDGKTRKECGAPAPAGRAFPAAPADADWWFWDGDETIPAASRVTTGASRYVFIDRDPDTGGCVADAGETYSADYLGLVPSSGCDTPLDCQAALGGQLADWRCEKDDGASLGTCLCGP